MIEAVDWREYDTFFEHVRATCSPTTGSLAMQAIVVPDERFDRLKRRTDFIKAAIFPGGCLPSVGALDRGRQSQRRPRRCTTATTSARHYAETLRRWRANLDDIAPELPALGLDDRFARLVALLLRVLRGRVRRALHQRRRSLSYAAPGAARVPRAAATARATPSHGSGLSGRTRWPNRPRPATTTGSACKPRPTSSACTT